MTFVLRPYIGADPLSFDMDSFAVAAVLGPPQAVKINRLGERAENRRGVGIRYSAADGKVAEIGLVPSESLVFEGHDLLHNPDPVGVLMTFDPVPLESVGFLVFLELGVTLTGFHDDDVSQQAATIFRRGRWDDVRSRMVPFVRQTPAPRE
jgi:hypothetical protein